MAKKKIIESEKAQIVPKKEFKKATDYVSQKRYNIVMQNRITNMNINSLTMYEMLKEQDSKLWSIDYKTFKYYYAKVNKALNKSFDANSEKLKNKYSNLTIKRLNDLYSKAIAKKDMKTALAVQNELSKFFLLGYYSKPQNENNINIQNTIPTTLEIQIIKSDLKDLNDTTNND